jgi:hypothetical protein
MTREEIKQVKMTNQEAIEILRDTPIDLRSPREDDIHTLYAKAQMMAIEALKLTSVKECSTCSDKGCCAIFDNFNIDYCSDYRGGQE